MFDILTLIVTVIISVLVITAVGACWYIDWALGLMATMAVISLTGAV